MISSNGGLESFNLLSALSVDFVFPGSLTYFLCYFIGSVYRFDCPAQNSLPLYLIVSGAVPLVWAVRCFSYQPCLCVDSHEDERRRLARQRKFEGMAIVDAGIFCFIFAWFVIGK